MKVGQIKLGKHLEVVGIMIGKVSRGKCITAGKYVAKQHPDSPICFVSY
jgi:hypothetical protein